jgi:hypothetical protein
MRLERKRTNFSRRSRPECIACQWQLNRSLRVIAVQESGSQFIRDSLVGSNGTGKLPHAMTIRAMV